jgi:type VI protein secretion system component Hcp
LNRFSLSTTIKEGFMKGFKVIVLVATILAAAPLFAAVDAFLKIDGIPGESTEPAHKDWIEIYSFSWGVSNLQTAAAHGSGGGAGHELQQATFIAGGKAVPKMFLLCQNGKLLPAVVVDLHGQRNTLENVMFASCQNNMMGDGSVRGTFNVKFERATIAGGVHTATPAGTARASMVAAAPSVSETPNGELKLGNNPAEAVNLLGLTSQGPNTVVLRLKGASPTLMRYCANGKHIPNGLITVRKAGKGQQEFLVVKLQEVIITGVTRNADGVTTLTLNFATMQGSTAGLESLQ